MKFCREQGLETFRAPHWSHSSNHRPPIPGQSCSLQDAKSSARAPRGLLFRELPEVRWGMFDPGLLMLSVRSSGSGSPRAFIPGGERLGGSICWVTLAPKLTPGGQGDQDGAGEPKYRPLPLFPETYRWNGSSRGFGSLMHERPEQPSRALCSE